MMPEIITKKQREFARAFVELQHGPSHGDACKALRSLGRGITPLSVRQLAFMNMHNPLVIEEIGRCWAEIHLGLKEVVDATICQCMRCGASFLPRTVRAKFCSIRCRMDAHNEKERLFSETKNCPRCGVAFTGRRSSTFCSYECRAVTLAERNRQKISSETAEKRAAWRQRSSVARSKERAALRALKELGIEV